MVIHRTIVSTVSNIPRS